MPCVRRQRRSPQGARPRAAGRAPGEACALQRAGGGPARALYTTPAAASPRDGGASPGRPSRKRPLWKEPQFPAGPPEEALASRGPAPEAARPRSDLRWRRPHRRQSPRGLPARRAARLPAARRRRAGRAESGGRTGLPCSASGGAAARRPAPRCRAGGGDGSSRAGEAASHRRTAAPHLSRRRGKEGGRAGKGWVAARRLTGSAGQPHSGACSPAAAGRGRAGAARGGAGRHVPCAMCRASHPAARLAPLLPRWAGPASDAGIRHLR